MFVAPLPAPPLAFSAEPPGGWLYLGEGEVRAASWAMSRAAFAAAPRGAGAPHFADALDVRVAPLPRAWLSKRGVPVVGCPRNKFACTLCRRDDTC